VHQIDPADGIDWGLVCGSEINDYRPHVSVVDDGVVFGFLFGDAGALPLEAGLDLGGGAHIQQGHSDILLAGFDHTGAYSWSDLYGDETPQFFASVEGSGSSFLLQAQYEESLSIDGFDFPAAGGDFIAQLDWEGNYAWHRLFPEGTDDSHVVIVDMVSAPDGAFALVGWFRETIDFGDGDVVTTPPDYYDGFAAVYESDGTLRHVHHLDGDGDQRGGAVAFAPDGGLAVAGVFDTEVDVGDGSPLVGAGPFLLSFAPDTTPQLKLQFDGTDVQYGKEVLVAPNGDMVLAGTFLGSLNLGGVDFVNTDTQEEETNYDIFVARFDAQGVYRWSSHIRSQAGRDDDLVAIGLDLGDQVHVVWSEENLGTRVSTLSDVGDLSESYSDGVSGARSAAFGEDGVLYVAGSTEDDVDFGAGSVPNAGSGDSWLMRVSL
jgi:hypothetical protein